MPDRPGRYVARRRPLRGRRGRAQCLGQRAADGGDPGGRPGAHVTSWCPGLARGIDTAAHTGAMRTGRTVAVIAGGIDVPTRRRIPICNGGSPEQHLIYRSPHRHRAPGPPFSAPQPHHRRPFAGRRRGGGRAAIRQPDHRPHRAGSGAGSVRGARLAARSARARRQRSDPPGRRSWSRPPPTCWTICRWQPAAIGRSQAAVWSRRTACGARGRCPGHRKHDAGATVLSLLSAGSDNG